MANRAYLYTADSPDDWERPEENYHDSRWVIPLAWFFFYRPADIRMVDVHFQGSHWREVKFAAEKAAALDLFARRKPLLVSLVGGRVAEGTLAELAGALAARPGRILLLDPKEVLGGMSQDDAWHAERFARIVVALDSEGAGQQVLEAAFPYVGDLDPDADRCRGQVVGYTYW